ncbi:MAG: hypothetical protein RLZ37_1436 [Actinomycetota bacterium]
MVWRRWESNPRPPACKAGALPTELRPLDGSVRLAARRVHSRSIDRDWSSPATYSEIHDTSAHAGGTA